MIGYLDRLGRWQDQFMGKHKPEVSWELHPITIKHGAYGVTPAYSVCLYTPKAWLWDERFFLHVNPVADSSPIKVEDEKKHRWITIHPVGEEGPGFRVAVQPKGLGRHEVVKGVGGLLNGAIITGIERPSDYRVRVREQEQMGV